MFRPRILPCLLLLLGTALPAAADEPRHLTLEEAVAIALQHNPEIGQSQAYGDYVTGRYREERAAALPQLTLDAYARRDYDASQPAGSITRELTGENVALTLTQPLYTFGKIGAAIRAAEVGLATADERQRQARQQVIRDVTAAFDDVLLALRRRELATENLAQKERHRDEAQKKLAAGVATDYDLLAAEVAVANARPELIRSENTVRLSQQRLALLLGDGQPVAVSGTLQGASIPVPSEAEALAVALERRPELREQRQRVGIYRELVTIAAAELKPRIDFRGGSGWTRWENTGDNGDGFGWNAGVYLNVPLFDGWRTSGRVLAAESDLRSRQLEEIQLRDRITLQVQQSLQGYAEATAIAAAQEGTATQARRLLQMAEEGFRYGVKTRLDIDDAQLGLLQAENDLARAHRDQQVAATELQWAMGILGETPAPPGEGG